MTDAHQDGNGAPIPGAGQAGDRVSLESDGEGRPGTKIEQAMHDALEAVEARAGASSGSSGGAAGSGVSGQSVDAAAAVTEALIAAKKELEEVLEQTRKEVGDLRDKWLRSAADLENYKKRMQREREETVKFGNEKLLRDFLPILDDLDRAIQATRSGLQDSPEKVLDGVVLVQKKFLAQLERHDVQSFESKGQAFDPGRHEAVQQVPSDLPPGTVADELQRGFLLNDRLLRPALVTVSLGPPTSKKPEDEQKLAGTAEPGA